MNVHTGEGTKHAHTHTTQHDEHASPHNNTHRHATTRNIYNITQHTNTLRTRHTLPVSLRRESEGREGRKDGASCEERKRHERAKKRDKDEKREMKRERDM